MKLNTEFVIMDVGGEITAVPIGNKPNSFHGVVYLNESAKEIFDLMKSDTDIEEITANLAKVYTDSTVDEIKGFVVEFVDGLRKDGFITD